MSAKKARINDGGVAAAPGEQSDQSIQGDLMSNIERLEIGPRMSQAVIHNGVVYLAGQVALDRPGASVKEQAQNILERTDKLLAAAGTDKTKLLQATIWLADMRTFDDMNSVWESWVANGATPARATVEAKLASPGYAVEMSFIAAR
jgi:enamine deaminase RidA (YjgF/YER057c/UK114 family)